MLPGSVVTRWLPARVLVAGSPTEVVRPLDGTGNVRVLRAASQAPGKGSVPDSCQPFSWK